MKVKGPSATPTSQQQQRRRRAITLPGSHAAPRRAVPFHSAKLVPAFDVIAELSTNRDAYTGGEAFALCQFPATLRTCADRLRQAVPASKKPGLSPTIACCISNGVMVIASHEDIRSLLSVKSRLDSVSDAADAGLVEEIGTWFTRFPLGVDNSSLSSVYRQNISLPEDVKSPACDLSSELGVSASALCTMAVMVTLATQPAMLPTHHERLNRTVDAFFRRVRIRSKAAVVLLEVVLEALGLDNDDNREGS